MSTEKSLEYPPQSHGAVSPGYGASHLHVMRRGSRGGVAHATWTHHYKCNVRLVPGGIAQATGNWYNPGGNTGRQLPGIAPRIHPVAAAVREPPDQDSRLRLVKPPALGLLCLVMPSAQAGKVALAGPSALGVRDRVILVAARSRIAAAWEPAGALANVDRMPQGRGWPVTLGLAFMKALASCEGLNGYGQSPLIRWSGAACRGLPARWTSPA